MKIGILTFHRGPNFGGYLQAMCLQEAVSDLGHQAEIINYKNKSHFDSEKFSWCFTRRPDRLLARRKKLLHWETIYQDLVKGDPIHDASGINWSSYDCIVVGSDVVWDYQTEKFGRDPVYFGVLPGVGPRKWVSYAASCGQASSRGLPDKMASGLRQFSAYGLRDQGTMDLVALVTGNEGTLVVDPTWLSEQSNDGKPKADTTELVIYSYAHFSPEQIEAVRQFAKKYRLEIVAYGFEKEWADRNVSSLHPEDWVKALGAARAIVTGTFHGTLYALKLGKPTAVVWNAWIENKVSAPLEMLDAKDILCRDGAQITATLEQQMTSDLTGRFVKSRAMRAASLEFLKNILD